MYFDIISKTNSIYSGPCEKVILKTKSGEITILDGHQNLISSLDIGQIRYFVDGTENKVFSDEGFLEVATNKDETKVTVLANRASIPSELFKEEIDRAVKAAEEEMTAKKGTISESVLIQLEKKIRYEKFLKDQAGL